MWYCELRDLHTIYSQVTDKQLLAHLRTVFAGLHETDVITILPSMMSMYEYVDSILDYINVIEDIRKRLAIAAMTITNEQVMDITSRVVLASGNYDTKCKHWNKIPPDQHTWVAWETNFCDTNAARIQADGARGEFCQPFS